MRWLALIALLAVKAAAQPVPSGWRAVSPGQWGGLNLLNDSTTLGGDAQAAQNVLTDSGYLEKRPGNTLLVTVSSGNSVQYVNDWVAPSGGRYLIAQATNTIYQTDFSGSPVVLSTIASGYTITTAPQFSRLYFADGFNPLWVWDGNSTGTVTDAQSGTAAPICTFVAAKDSRLWCANIPNESSSRVRISSQGGAGYWVVPSNVSEIDNAANVTDLNPNDGDSITCMSATPWGMFTSKRYSSYIIKGNGNLSYDTRIVDPKIGCVDNRSVQMVYGVLQWLAADGVYGYDGSGPPHLLSREIDPLMKTVRAVTYSEGQWATQLQSDWATGTTSSGTAGIPAASWDFNSIAAEIFPSSFTMYDDNSNHALQPTHGLGFTDDTLVHIDTMTYPLSVGVAQLAPSTSPTLGPYIWSDNFSDGDFTAGVTTWTASSGTGSIDTAIGGKWLASTTDRVTLHTSAGSPIMTHGSWSFNLRCVTGSVLGFLHYCGTSSGDVIASFDFMNDYLGNYYRFNVIDNTPGGGANDTIVTLVKHYLGSDTLLGTTYYQNLSAIISTFTITMDQSGNMALYAADAGLLLSANDTSITSSGFQAISLVGYSGSKTEATSFQASQYAPTGSIRSRIYDTKMSVPVSGFFLSSYTLPGIPGETGIAFQVRSSSSPNNDMWGAFQYASSATVSTLNKRYWQYNADFTTSVSSLTPQLGYISLVGITTGYYYSKVNYIGTSITAWKQFGVSEDVPGTYGYAVRSATYSFVSTATVPSWTTQTANQNVSVATGSYAQFRLDSTAITNASLAEPITAVFLRWSQGANIPVASATLDRRYMLCVAISTAATAPDTCLILQKNGKWVKWIGPSVGAMGYYNYNMIAADGGTSSKVWEIMQPGVLNDDGTAIDAFWVSADYTDGLVFTSKILHEAWIDATPVSGSSVTFSYITDKSTAWTNYTFSTDNGGSLDTTLTASGIAQYGSMNKFIPLDAGYALGKYIRVRFRDANLSSYFRLNNYLLYVENLGRSIP